jgi:hypothetical protein
VGGSSVKVPAPSAEEKLLQKAQADLLAQQTQIIQQQQQQQKVLLPFLGEQLGFDLQTDADGNITGVTKRAKTDLEAQDESIQRQLNQRTLDALSGSLPVDPTLEQNITKQEKTLRERLTQQFGPGYESSSPAIETLGDFFRNAESLRAGARTGQLTLAEQLGLNRQQVAQQERATQLGGLAGAAGQPLTLAEAFGNIAGGYGAAQQPFLQQRQLQTQASIANASRPNPLAQIAGVGAGVAFSSLFSDARHKKNISPVGTDFADGIPFVEYQWDWEPDDAPKRMGILAQDVEKRFPSAVTEHYGADGKGGKFIDTRKLAALAAADALRSGMPGAKGAAPIQISQPGPSEARL